MFTEIQQYDPLQYHLASGCNRPLAKKKRKMEAKVGTSAYITFLWKSWLSRCFIWRLHTAANKRGDIPGPAHRPTIHLAETHLCEANPACYTLQFQKLYCRLTGRKSEVTFVNKLLINKITLKPVWTYGIQPVSYTHLDVYKRQLRTSADYFNR